MDNSVVRVNLSGLSSEVALPEKRRWDETVEDEEEWLTKVTKDVKEAEKGGGLVDSVPFWPSQRNKWDDLRGSARAYRWAREARKKYVGAPGAESAAKALEGCARDAAVWRCVKLTGPTNEQAYLHALDAAFEGQLEGDKDLKSQLLNSFHHSLGADPDAFKSKSSQKGRRRQLKNNDGRPRETPRRRHRRRESNTPPERAEGDLRRRARSCIMAAGSNNSNHLASKARN